MTLAKVFEKNEILRNGWGRLDLSWKYVTEKLDAWIAEENPTIISITATQHPYGHPHTSARAQIVVLYKEAENG